MEPRKTVVERAFEIAAEGQCKTTTQIRMKLKGEGFSNIDTYLQGRGIRAQLKAIMLRAQGEA